MSDARHWEQIYGTKDPDRVSWYTPHLGLSLDLISALGLSSQAPLIDVGGAAATLASDLLAAGHRDITVLDLSAQALAVAQARMGADAERVTWVVGDVTDVALPASHYDVWHDRAVFHFLTSAPARDAYLRQVRRALKAGGHAIVATFATSGPDQCSGLDVVRYDDTTLPATFGATFERVRCLEETHVTPWGSEQAFVYCLCRRR